MKPFVIVAAIPAVPVVWLLGQAGSNAAPPPALPFENVGQVWLAIILLAGNVFTNFMSSRREEKARLWLIEDRKAATELADKTAMRIRADLLHEAEVIKMEAWKRTDFLTEQIAENTRISGGMGQRRPSDDPPSHDRRSGDEPDDGEPGNGGL